MDKPISLRPRFYGRGERKRRHRVKTAIFIKDLRGPKFRGDAQLFRLDPPLEETDYEGKKKSHEFVVVSSVMAFMQGPETFIFPADAKGSVTNWGELTGSFRGSLDIDRALRNAGYKVFR